MIPYGRQDLNQDDIDAVIKVLESDYLTQGPKIPEFERSIIDYCDVEFAVAVNSSTSALHIACLALGVSKGDLVWTSPISFVASANCALYCDASIDFVDIDPVTYNLSIEKLEYKLIKARADNQQLPKVLIPVHLSGQSCDMERIYTLSKEYGFSIIEDAAHAIGGYYKDKPVGSCKYSDITVFSFHPVKIITTAEGGVATTNNLELDKKMRLYRSHGVTREPSEMTKEPDGPWYYQQIVLGYNYRMSDIQAALGISQMKRLDSFIVKRNEIAAHYDKFLTNMPLITPVQKVNLLSSRHLYIIRLDLPNLIKTRNEIFQELRNEGLGVNVHYIPIHLQPFFKQIGFKLGDFPEAESYYEDAISIPLFPQMTHHEVNKVVDVLEHVLIAN